MSLRESFYLIKPLVPRQLQLFLRRKLIAYKRALLSGVWPIDPKAASEPSGWKGWPDDKEFAVILTHDVESAPGQEKVWQLMKLEKELGFRSSYNFVPERYQVSAELRNHLHDNGFEVGVHGLNHDGKLYRSKEIFNKRAKKINHYLQQWNAVGFRSPAMHHNLDWLHAVDIKYDLSTFDTDPFEPQNDRVGTIFPFYVTGNNGYKGYLEMPYTLPQDFTLFILMKEPSNDIWKRKLDWIAQHGGMVLMNTHPDYMHFGSGKMDIEEYPVDFYLKFLEFVKLRYGNQYWHGLPKQLASFHSETYSNKKLQVDEV